MNKSFTWSNGRRAPTLERLDRALVSKDWHLHFPRSTLKALPRPRSDHTPLLLTAFSFVPSPCLFRFEAYWLRFPAVSQVVSNAWTDPPIGGGVASRISFKLSSVQKALISWSTGLTSSSTAQIKLCLKWLEWLDLAEEVRILSDDECSLRPLLKMRHDELSLLEEIRWKQRSRVKWLKTGDANTKFFHLKASIRQSKNHISQLSDGTSLRTSQDAIAAHLYDTFVKQLGVATDRSANVDLASLFLSDDPDIDFQGLQAPFGVEEVRSAIFSCAPEKAPGPDGFPLLFFHRFWHVIKDDIMAFFSNFYSGTLDL